MGERHPPPPGGMNPAEERALVPRRIAPRVIEDARAEMDVLIHRFLCFVDANVSSVMRAARSASAHATPALSHERERQRRRRPAVDAAARPASSSS